MNQLRYIKVIIIVETSLLRPTPIDDVLVERATGELVETYTDFCDFFKFKNSLKFAIFYELKSTCHEFSFYDSTQKNIASQFTKVRDC